MISQENLNKLSEVATPIKALILEALEGIKEGINNNNLFFLKMLKNKVPFLKFIDDDNLERLAPLILANLKVIKTYNGLVNVLKAIYGTGVTVFFITSESPGVVNVDIEGDLGEFDTIMLQGGADAIFQNGSDIALRGYGALQNYSFNDFLLNFILAGVHMLPPTVNQQVITRVLANNDNVLLNNESILIKEEVL